MPSPPPHFLDRPQRRDRPVPDGKTWIRDQKLRREIVPDAQAFAREAHPLRTVEAEELRTGRVEAQPAGGAGIMRRKQEIGLALGRHDDRPVAQLEGLLDCFGQPPALGGPQSRRALSRSMTASMWCLIWRLSDRSSDRLTTCPLTLARTYPARDSSAKRSLYSPFWPRTTGARTRNDAPAGDFLKDPLDDLLARLGRDHAGRSSGNAPAPPGQKARADNR